MKLVINICIVIFIILISVQCFAGPFDALGDDEWLNLSPTLLQPGTSQMGAGYDQTNDFLITFGGHSYGGGYPQVDWTGIYDINAGVQSTWTIPSKYSPATSTVPPAACEASGNYDPVNELYVLWSTAGFLSTRYEWVRRFYCVENARRPFVYDYSTDTWFLSGFLGYDQISFRGRMPYNYDTQELFQGNSDHEPQERFGTLNMWTNTYTTVNTSAWAALGPGRSLSCARDDMCLVYDESRDRFWGVGGHFLTSDEGVNGEYQTVWYSSTTDYVWTQVSEVTPSEYLWESFDLGEGINQWTGASGVTVGNLDSTSKLQGSYGFHINSPSADAYLYKNYTSWDHVRTYIRGFKVVTDNMSNGEQTAIVRHYNQTNGEVSTLWLYKTGDQLYLDVQLAGGSPTTGVTVSTGTWYHLMYETYVNASGYTKLSVNHQTWDSPDVTRSGDMTAVGNVDRVYWGVFDDNSGNLETYNDSFFHWNPDVSFCYMPWIGNAYGADYDPIHDRIVMFVLYQNLQEEEDESPSTNNLEVLEKVFIYNPNTATWTTGTDRGTNSAGPRRDKDLNVRYSDTYNVFFSVENGRCGTNCSTLWAYRLDDDTSGYTPRSLARTSTAPAYPRFGYVEMSGVTSATVHWTPRDGTVDGYNVYRAELSFDLYEKDVAIGLSNELTSYDRDVVKGITRPDWTDFAKLNGDLVVGTSYTDTTISDVTGYAHIYAYVVKSSKDGTESGPSPFWSTIPEFPTGVNVTSDDTNWYLNWTAPHNGGTGIAGYRIFYSPTSTTMVEYTTGGAVEGVSATIPKATVGSGSMKFFVVAVDDLGQEGFPSNGAWTYHPDYAAYYDQYFTLSIITTSLANGTVGSAYSETVYATSGTSPYAWSISAGSLPNGLNINNSTGVISGTPTAEGDNSFTVQVTDDVSDTDTQELSIHIDAGDTPAVHSFHGLGGSGVSNR